MSLSGIIIEAIKEQDNPCWDGYEQVGMKTKNGKQVPNCVPKNEEINESDEDDNEDCGCGCNH